MAYLSTWSLILATVLGSCLCQDSYYFNVQPAATTQAAEGSEVRLDCDVNDRRHIAFHWQQNGKNLQNTSRKYQEDSNLRILRVLRGVDEGVYKCIAVNTTTKYDIMSNEAQLKVLWIDDKSSVVLKRPKKEEIVPGCDVILRCQVSGYKTPTILWYHNKFRVVSGGQTRILENGQKLRLSNISAANNGVYSCRASNTAGGVESSDNFFLNVGGRGFPQLQESEYTPYQLALKSKAARLDCPFQHASKIDWFSSHEKLVNNSRHVIYPNGSLYFPNVQSSDEGTYRCESYGIQSDLKSQSFTAQLALSELESITSESFEPRLVPNFPIVLTVNDRFEIKVFPPSGRPSPDYRWLDQYDRVIGTSGSKWVKDTTTLVFENPQEKDAGNYTFVANNTWGERSQEVWVEVSVPPIVSWVIRPKQVKEDRKATFRCKSTGTDYPVTTITWTKDGVPLPMHSKFYRIDVAKGTLEFLRVRASDEGDYRCVANATGHPVDISPKGIFKVDRKLKFNPPLQRVYDLVYSRRQTVRCHAEASGSPIVMWLRPNTKGLPPGMHDERGDLEISRVDWTHAGEYVCVASHNKQRINFTAVFRVVELPKFRIRPDNMTTVYEGRRAMIHCISMGEPRPLITWDKDGRVIGTSEQSEIQQQQQLQQDKHQRQQQQRREQRQDQEEKDGESSPSESRYHVFPNGTLLVRKVLIEDRGKYGCMANNSAGMVRADFQLVITKPLDREDSFDVAKTVVIVVCSAGAYLALVIGLMAFCSYRLLAQRKNRKQLGTANGKNAKFGRQGGANGGGSGDFGSNNVHQNPHLREQHELLMKDRDSGCGVGGGGGGGGGAGFNSSGTSGIANGTGGVSGVGIVGGLGIYQLQQSRSDSDNRSHASGMSSHPSHSSTSASASGIVSGGGGGGGSAAGAGGLTAAAFRARSASLDRFQFPRQDLQTLGIIGKGQFGDIFLAKARAIRPMEGETLVVVKSLLNKSEAATAEFYAELEMYGKLEHPNVARLLGVCREMEPVFMVTEYCDWGDLKQFLLATRTDSGRRLMGGMGMGGTGGVGVGGPRVPPLSAMQRLKMCQQVALGMEYLAGYRMVHRDLAARNVMLTSRLDLKVCSLSLSRDVYANEYFNHPAQPGHRMPLRWLPPEAVRDAEYSFPTDIWSYGVFMWEVFHLCDLPYRLHGDEDIYKAMCGAGTPGVGSQSGVGSIPRLDFVEHCPHQVVDIVLQCCATNAVVRPSFSDLVVTLGHLLTNGDCV